MEGEHPTSPAAATTILEATPSAAMEHADGDKDKDRDKATSHPSGTESPHTASPHKDGAIFPTDFRSISTGQFIDPAAAAAWREKAGAFVSSSSLRIRNVASKAGTTVAEAAGEASTKMKDTWQAVQPRMAEAASKAGASVKETWETTKENWTNKVAPRMEAGISVAMKSATDTGLKLRQGLYETTEKVKASKVGQMTKAGVERSQALLSKNEWRTKTMRAEAAADGTSVFGVPLEVVAARGVTTGCPVPGIVIQCCEYLLEHGVSTPYIFETEGDSSVVKRIMKGFDEDRDMRIPEGTDSLDVAQLLLVYFKCLPEPLLTHRLYPDFVSFGGTDVQHLCRLLRTLPTPNLETLNRVLALLHSVTLHSDQNKMDAQSLAAEFAPVLLWKEGVTGSQSADHSSGAVRAANSKESSVLSAGSSLLQPVGRSASVDGEESTRVIVDVDGNVAAAAEIPVDIDEPTHEQTSLVEAVMVLVEQHPSIFSHSPNGPVMLLP